MNHQELIKTADQLKIWLDKHRISEIECILADMSGVARGKIVPKNKFIDNVKKAMLRLPESVFQQSVTGDVSKSSIISPAENDMILIPDVKSIRIVPWYQEPTAVIICDTYKTNFLPIEFNPRFVLKKIIALYEKIGCKAIVGPEIEFYLVKKNIDADYPLEPPVGQSGRSETVRQPYGIDAVNEFDPIFEDMYEYCEKQELSVDTLIHEAGSAQVEINFDHAEPLDIADQIFLFKRVVRQAALKHGIYATFMAKPHRYEPGSSMHIHQSIVDAKSGKNLFARQDNSNSEFFEFFVGGLQKYLAPAMLLLAPNVNSYRRVIRNWAAPVNTMWGVENRTVGLRVPHSSIKDRRIENRIPGADANPYLALATSLACGYLGIVEKIKPTKQIETGKSAYNSSDNELPGYLLPRHLLDAIKKLNEEKKLHEILGEQFVNLFIEVKKVEYENYQSVVSAWEREHLLLNV